MKNILRTKTFCKVMMKEMNSLWVVLLLFFLSLDPSLANENEFQDTFHVKPGAGTLSVEGEAGGGYKCKFTYSAQGGTHEEWHIMMTSNSSGLICSVERSGDYSYLFFEHFKLEMTGPKVEITEMEIMDSKRDNKRCALEEYAADKNSVSSVKGRFKNHLERIAVMSPPVSTRDDL